MGGNDDVCAGGGSYDPVRVKCTIKEHWEGLIEWDG